MLDSFYIVTHAGRVESLPGSTVVALGTFDGVHIAHKAILREAVALKERVGATFVGAWCFSELPANVLGKKNTPMICTLEEKIERILISGMDFVAVGDLRALAEVSAEDFVDKILVERLGCIGAVCGFNNRFGHKGLGNSALLYDRFGKDGAAVVDEITLDGETVSSSAIREHILNGELKIARDMLAQPVSLTAPVVGGKQLGHSLGFPTANQTFPDNLIIPKNGIYATLCYTESGERYIGVSNVGIRPTITDGSDSHHVNCETFICNFDRSIYGENLRVEFCKYLREEQKFDSVEALRDQIARDVKGALAYFESVGIKA